MITRRDALKRMGAIAGAVAGGSLVDGCSTGSATGGDGGGGEGGDGGAPAQGITTVVTLCMENRSYDHFLGARSLLEGKPGDGLTANMSNPDMDGTMVKVYPATVPCVEDPPHSWGSSHMQFGAGLNDGFMRAYRERYGALVEPHVMAYMTRKELPVSWALADAHTSFDRWFCSLLGPTWPNRLYLHSAQSNGQTKNELPGALGFTHTSLYHRLNDAKVSWAYYYSDLPFLSLWKGIAVPGSMRPIQRFFDDAAAGTLPSVVMIDPAFGRNDDHPPHHPILGQQLIAALYSALAKSPQWKNVLFCVTYDEHGGFFDHVPPPKVPDDRAAEGFDQLGFRVPTLIAGPYVKPGHVSSTLHDHTSIARHIGKMFGLPPLTKRDAAANDLSDALDLDRLARLDPLPPATIPAVVIDESTITAACEANGPNALDLAADAGLIDPSLDRRRFVKETIMDVGDALDRLGGGRVRRGR